MGCLTAEEVAAWPPYAQAGGLSPLQRTRQRMERTGQWRDWQMLGRRFAIACVALEITQRCNLDCTYCYLSEASEALKDIPLPEVLRRIDLIHAHYGDHTDVQVTGGDPTLRKRDDLIQIVRYIKAKHMRSSLFTNGIKATRELLQELCAAGLEDVAFHVDVTQQRKGYGSERELNAVREQYIARVHGLPLSVFFNTTVCPENFHEIPELVRFFVKHCAVVRLAAFQSGADSGRGALRERVAVSAQTIQAQIEQGLGTRLNFDAANSGHADCNRYACGLVINGRVYDFLSDAELVQSVLTQSAHLAFERADKLKAVAGMARFIASKPELLLRTIVRATRMAWAARRDLLAARGRIGKLSFHIHNFQDAAALDRERCEACSFMVMTPQGPLSMCVHNAKRDSYLLVPAQIQQQDQLMFWNPATGKVQAQRPSKIEVSLSRKNARGRAKSRLSVAGLIGAT